MFSISDGPQLASTATLSILACRVLKGINSSVTKCSGSRFRVSFNCIYPVEHSRTLSIKGRKTAEIYQLSLHSKLKSVLGK